MSEHMPKEPLPKSTRKAQHSTDAAPSTAQGPNDEMIRLQRLVGNHAVQRMLIQTKMTVGAADDPYEREADSVASQVMAQRDTTIQRANMEEEEPLQGKRIDIVQRADMEEEEPLQGKRIDIVQRAPGVSVDDDPALEEEADMMGAKAVSRKNDEQINLNESFDVEQDVESKISAKSGNGQAIPDVNREMFESSMGHDFSGVNVHADSESDSLNKQIGARAFTTGSDIFFRQGEYNPASSGGQELLAHELTHVVQQGGVGVQKKSEDENA
jgi:hypothetical protein